MNKSEYLKLCGYNSESFTILDNDESQKVLALPQASLNCRVIIDPTGVKLFGSGAHVVKKAFLIKNEINLADVEVMDGPEPMATPVEPKPMPLPPLPTSIAPKPNDTPEVLPPLPMMDVTVFAEDAIEEQQYDNFECKNESSIGDRCTTQCDYCAKANKNGRTVQEQIDYEQAKSKENLQKKIDASANAIVDPEITAEEFEESEDDNPNSKLNVNIREYERLGFMKEGDFMVLDKWKKAISAIMSESQVAFRQGLAFYQNQIDKMEVKPTNEAKAEPKKEVKAKEVKKVKVEAKPVEKEPEIVQEEKVAVDEVKKRADKKAPVEVKVTPPIPSANNKRMSQLDLADELISLLQDFKDSVYNLDSIAEIVSNDKVKDDTKLKLITAIIKEQK